MTAKPVSSLRSSAIAGKWYPGSVSDLRRTIDNYLSDVVTVDQQSRLLALIAPHAGYSYSGPTAAKAFAQLRGRSFSRVLLFGPLHRPIRGYKTSAHMTVAENAYRTPLGDVGVDRAFIDSLARRIPITCVQGDEEHSLEIELPFLQVVLGDFSLVPLMFGEYIGHRGVSDRQDALAAALVELWDERTLLVVSTDLSHQDNYEDVIRTDRILVEHVASFDVGGLTRALQEERVQACGATGLVAALQTAQKLGAQRANILGYATSGDVTGLKAPGNYTVGYLAAAVYA